ncbi:MAG: oxygen-independent coproporphyrinogen III oxidase [Candidatus Kapaibacterium sp.]
MPNTTKFNINKDLLKRYERRGPRYTSYPTAPYFHQGIGPDDYIAELSRTNNQSDEPDLSLYFHIPFCKSKCLYCGCNSLPAPGRAVVDEYINCLIKEMTILKSMLNTARQVVQIHFGGGTPNYLEISQIRTIFDEIIQSFNIADDSEISIELDPRLLSGEYLSALRQTGFNRLSLGIQDLNPRIQKTVNRIHPEQKIRELVKNIRSLHFHSLNFDLIYGLPYQTLPEYEDTLDRVLDMSPDRLAIYNFAYLPEIMHHQKQLPAEALPDSEEKLDILNMIINKTTKAGYIYIGMDHFAKESDELAKAFRNNSLHRNFQGYTAKSGTEVIAMGTTAISQLRRMYTQNTKSQEKYFSMINKGILPVEKGYMLNDDDIMRRYVINQLMCNGFLSKNEFNQKFGTDFDEYFSVEITELNGFIEDGLLVSNQHKIEVSGAGMLIVRNIAMVFDKYLKDNPPRKMYSKTL